MSTEYMEQNYPRAWDSRIDELAGVFELDVAGLRSTIKVTPAQLRKVYLPLLAWLDEMSRTSDRRLLVALAGVPGSGKSTFAAVVGLLADRVLRVHPETLERRPRRADKHRRDAGATPVSGYTPRPGALVCVGMDGWHWPNRILQERTTRNPDGRVVPLSQRKGGPESFDVAALAAALGELKNARVPVRLPIYDRRLHEPVADGLIVPPETRIILLEGNYVLCPTPPWDRVFKQLHPRLMLVADPAVARQLVIDRHVRGGMSPAQAEEKFARNDRLNIELVQGTAVHADRLIDLTQGLRNRFTIPG